MDNGFIKAMLEGYKSLGILADISDRKVLDIAIKSSCFDGRPCNIINDINAITMLTNHKIKLINLKVLVMDMVSFLPYKYRQAARYRFIDGCKVSAVAEFLGLSIRSVFRLLHVIPKMCNEYFETKGLDDSWFLKNYGNEKWLMKLCKYKEKKSVSFKKNNIKMIFDVNQSNTKLHTTSM